MTTATCIHFWMIESPNGKFSLAKCKKCGKYDAMLNALPEGGMWAGSPAAQAKRTPTQEDIERKVFLQERIKEDKEKKLVLQESLKTEPELRKRTYVQYTNNIKTQVLLALTRGKTITEVSRIYKVPTSTINGWKRTYFNYSKAKTSGNIEIFKKIIIEKIELNNNISSIAKDYDMPRRTLRDWIKKQVA